MLFIEYPKCTTCRKAKKWLDDNSLKYEERHIVTDNPSKAELKEWIELSGLPIKKFFNTSGKIYKERNLKEKLKNMSYEEQIELLASNGMLVKRPILVKDSSVLVGFKIEEWEGLLI